MFKDWYNDYLKMIYPCSVEDEFEYSWNKKVIEIETREVVAIIEAARFCLDLIQCKLLGSEQIVIYKGTRLNPDASNIRWAVNHLGVLKTIITKGQLNSECSNAVYQTINDFEKIFQHDHEKIQILFLSEVEKELSRCLSAWQKFVTECLKTQAPNGHWDFWWDTDANDLITWCPDSDERKENYEFLDYEPYELPHPATRGWGF